MSWYILVFIITFIKTGAPEPVEAFLNMAGGLLFFLNMKNSTGPKAPVEIDVIMNTSIYQDIEITKQSTPLSMNLQEIH